MDVVRIAESEWGEIASYMGVRKEVEEVGYVATKRMLDKTLEPADPAGDSFTDDEVDVLSSHLPSVELNPGALKELGAKVIWHSTKPLRTSTRLECAGHWQHGDVGSRLDQRQV